ncbi:MAG: sialidase family protein [Capsulimonadaceae bacterium]|nr:sialidase family protein [Capsulimonadaceae bacterium]
MRRFASFPITKFKFILTVLIISTICSVHTDASPLVVSGTGFTISKLIEGGEAFVNRNYVWRNLPASLAGWDFTELAGGEPATIIANASEDVCIYIATEDVSTGVPGWERVDGLRFAYDDKKHTALAVFRHTFRAGSIVSIPQQGWTGAIVLMPSLSALDKSAPAPGVVVAHSPKETAAYLGSPSIVIMPDGSYIASHDLFGPGTTRDEARIYRSNDRGITWTMIADLRGIWWATLFFHHDALYLMGVDHENGRVVIRRSEDGGVHWTTATDSRTGMLLADHAYCCGPGPVVVYSGRIWRAMEDWGPAEPGAKGYRAFVMSAPENADLLNASNWKASNRLTYQASWPGTNWLEGNMVITPDNQLVDVIRINSVEGETAAMIHVSSDGETLSYDPSTDLLAFPGGGARFTIRYDAETQLYWSLVNKQQNPRAYRNILALTSSPDLRHWTVDSVILQDPDSVFVAFQYVDWQFDGHDLIALSRTAYGGAHKAHDANYITFHRIANFRSLRPTQATPRALDN